MTTWTGPESVIKVRKYQVPGRVDGTTHGSIQVRLLRKRDVVVGVCLAVPNPTFHAWLHLAGLVKEAHGKSDSNIITPILSGCFF